MSNTPCGVAGGWDCIDRLATESVSGELESTLSAWRAVDCQEFHATSESHPRAVAERRRRFTGK